MKTNLIELAMRAYERSEARRLAELAAHREADIALFARCLQELSPELHIDISDVEFRGQPDTQHSLWVSLEHNRKLVFYPHSRSLLNGARFVLRIGQSEWSFETLEDLGRIITNLRSWGMWE